MNSDIVSKYKIKFEKVLEKIYGQNDSDKIACIQDERLFDFLFNWSNPVYINEDLMPAIEDAMNGRLSVEENDVTGGSTLVILTSTAAKTYSINATSLATPVSTIPIHDFKQIVEGWRDCLLT